MRSAIRWALAVVLLSLVACDVSEWGAEGERVEVQKPDGASERGRIRAQVGEPYPYDVPAPPEQETPIDGIYRRTVSVRAAGGRPVYCRRCAPWRLDAGEAELIFERGRFFATFTPIPTEPQCDECKRPPGFEASGHYTVEGERLELVNDANCIGMSGIYEWNVGGGELTLEAIEDRCPFVRLRAKYLTASPWTWAS